MNFIARFFSGIISCFVFKPLKKRIILLFLIIFGALILVVINKPQLSYRYTTEFVGHLNFKSGNWGALRGISNKV